ncbi:MAG: DNA cytosine methyltransferase [Thermoguttaceae bacterium]|nr:DNA cytosine methyltransferase [Thermoguttaceae bacterium]MBQ9128016.1 DNA cytosine methyltransferase [Thermoguttaceae bacterium]
MKSSRPIVVDLFAGCGGLSLGFEQAGFDVAAAVEIDPIHSAVHEYNFPYAAAICSDVKLLSGAAIRERSGIGDADIDVVVGGAPCQGFSLMGKRSFDDPRNQLVLHYVRLVGELKPKYCVFENVKGLTLGKHAKFLNDLIEELAKIGYEVRLPYKVLNAADFGTPQNRERLIILGARKGQKLPEYPLPFEYKVTVGEAISDLPNADDFEELKDDDSVAVEWETTASYARKLRGLEKDATDFSYKREHDPNKLTSSLRTEHTATSRERFLATENGKVEPKSRFFKLDFEGRSNTLRAGTDSARGAFTSPRPIHPTHPRVITVREAARLHSYPDWFRFHKTKWHGMREIGNSVPPSLARAVASKIIEALGVEPTRPRKTLKPGSENLLEFDMSAAANYFEVSRHVIAQRTRKNAAAKENDSDGEEK